MNTAFYTAVSGMGAFQRDLDLISHNMANVNTIGFKPSKSNFNEILYTQMDTNVPEDNQVGHGVKSASANLIFTEGTLIQTERDLDFAILGSGFFCIDGTDKNKEYTRNGVFSIGLKGSRAYLVTEDGSYVLDKSKRKIEIKNDRSTGQPDLTKLKDMIGVFTVENPDGFQIGSNGRFNETENTGKIKGTNSSSKNLTYELANQTLELSAADISKEMIQMMLTQRAFQLNAKVVQTADAVEEVINNLR